ncbi:MAG: hypothetical protein CMJ31_08555 [Phycisphaerae bacterium]|nr:hypothetical protein [Phycisphaerae bacterium]
MRPRPHRLLALVACVSCLFAACDGKQPTRQPTRSVVAQPDALTAILQTAQSAVAEGDNAKAETVLREAVRTYPRDHDLRMALGDLLTAVAKHDEAHRQYEEAIAIDSNDPVALFQSGMTARLSGDDETGLDRLVAARNADPTNAEYAMQAGLVQLEAGRVDDASVSLLQAAALDDARAVVWGSLAEIALRQGDPSVATDHARRAHAIEPRVLAWTILLARSLKRDGQPEQALALLDGLEGERRYASAVLQTAGECLGLLGRPAEAAVWHAEAADRFPGDEELAYQTALWYERAGDIANALDHAGRAAGFGHQNAQRLAERLQGAEADP